MKIGIVSCYYHHNYGSMLQAYATQEIVKQLGHTAITFSCKTPILYMTQSRIRYYLHKVINLEILRTNVRKRYNLRRRSKFVKVEQGVKLRNILFEEFYKKKILLSEEFSNRKELEAFSSQCDAVIVGSDMLWHPVNVEHDYFTLSFVPDNVNKISYATSIGTTRIPHYQKRIYKKFLNRFGSISVREQSGVDVIQKLGIDKRVTVVLDPTLLFTADKWMSIQSKAPFIQDDYILCYFLGVNEKHRAFAKKLREVTGYQIVALQHLDEFVEDDMGYADQAPYNVGPGEFINLVRNAKLVCTDSFHGTCFSIINHKDFFVLNRFSNSNSQSTNTRLDSLLSIVGLQDRRIDGEFNGRVLDMLHREIDYSIVDEKIKKEREKSLNYLKEALAQTKKE